jgi:hypothetical protein
MNHNANILDRTGGDLVRDSDGRLWLQMVVGGVRRISYVGRMEAVDAVALAASRGQRLYDVGRDAHWQRVRPGRPFAGAS